MFNKVYIGSTPVKQIYLGTQKIKYGETELPPVVDSDLLVHLRADTIEGNRMIDLSGRGNHFDIVPIPTEKNNYIVDIKGMKYIDTALMEVGTRPLASDKSICTADELTIYIKAGVTVDNFGQYMLVDGTSESKNIILMYKGSKYYFRGVDADGVRQDIPLFRNSLTKSPERLVCTIAKNGTITGYYNGFKGFEKAFKKPPVTSVSSCALGSLTSDQKFQSKMRIGEVMIFNRVLSEEEIKKLDYR